MVGPFVYRRYLDYGVFEALRQLHRKIRDEANRRARALYDSYIRSDGHIRYRLAL